MATMTCANHNQVFPADGWCPGCVEEFRKQDGQPADGVWADCIKAMRLHLLNIDCDLASAKEMLVKAEAARSNCKLRWDRLDHQKSTLLRALRALQPRTEQPNEVT